MAKTITSWKFEEHTAWYKIKLTLDLVDKFIAQWDYDPQSIPDKTPKDYTLQEFFVYITNILDEENKRLNKRNTEL